VEKVATPEPLIVLVPIGVAPSKKVTVPVGTPAPGLLTATVAEKDTVWPKTGAATEDDTVVVVEAAVTA
jgi:hypothetical protein